MPVIGASISGLGHSPAFLVEGSWVFGYFRDGEAMQEPVVLGSILADLMSWPIQTKDFTTLTAYTQSTRMK